MFAGRSHQSGRFSFAVWTGIGPDDKSLCSNGAAKDRRMSGGPRFSKVFPVRGLAKQAADGSMQEIRAQYERRE